LPTFDNTLQDEFLDTDEQYTYLMSYAQYPAPTHLASYITLDEQYADTLTHPTSYAPNATLTHLTEQYADAAPKHLTSYVAPTYLASYVCCLSNFTHIIAC